MENIEKIDTFRIFYCLPTYLLLAYGLLFILYGSYTRLKYREKLAKEADVRREVAQKRFNDQVLPKITSLTEVLVYGGKMPATQADKLLKQFRLLLMIAAIVEEDKIKWLGDIDWLEMINKELEEQGGEFHPIIAISLTEGNIYLNWTGLGRTFMLEIDSAWIRQSD